MPITLVDMSFTSPATLSGGSHLIVVLIDNEPAITDFTALSDIGDNDMVATIPVTINGDTALNINYNTLNWTAFGDL